MRKNDIDRFKSYINKTNSCWVWTGTLNYKNYGVFTFEGKSIGAHRFSYLISKGIIQKGLVIDHLCRNRRCVNPQHLEAITNKENCNRGETGTPNRTKTHCPKGHSYGGSNLYVRKEGWRMCKKCAKIANKKHKERN